MKKIDRRKFIKQGSAMGVAGLLSGPVFQAYGSTGLFGRPDMVIYTGLDYFEGTIAAVKKLGGMKKFVEKGQKVGLLVNSDFEIPGAYVNPDIVIATVKMCLDEGASEVSCIQNIKQEYWERSKYYNDFADEIANLNINKNNQFPAKFDERYWKKTKIDGSKALKEVEITKAFFDCDVFINIPVAKHHALTNFTGALKNTMGVGTRETNVYYHLGSDKRNDPVFFAECIADINTLRKADLVISDATLFITSGGPVGPGDTRQPNKIVAGTDPVAVDALTCTYSGLLPDDIEMIKRCHQRGIGRMDYNNLKIKDIT